MSDAVRIVVVSHSADLARGVVDLAGQMAPDVELVAAGGDDDGALGTSFDRIAAALAQPPAGGVVVLYDLGSALLSTETAVEFLDEDEAARVDVVDAPLVEGAIAAAVAAQGGAPRARTAEAARSAVGEHRAADVDAPDDAPDDDAVTREAVLRNPLGLHARPAAELTKALAGYAARVCVGPAGGTAADVRSVLDVVRLALRGGQTVTITATGDQAAVAADRAAELVGSGFDESDDDAGPTPASPTTDGPVPGAPGRALGPLAHAGAVHIPEPDGAQPVDADAENVRLRDAIGRAADELREGDVLARVHAAMLDDPTLRAAAADAVARGRPAASAWWDAVTASADELAGAADEMVAARAADVRDAGTTVLRELGVVVERIPADVDGCVLAADEIGPAELGDFAQRGGAAVVLSGGSPTAHAVIVARGLGLPVVLRAGELLAEVPAGTQVALDGTAGTVDVDPPDVAQRRAAIEAERTARAEALADAAAPVHVAGHLIVVAANIGSLAEARAAVENGADAVGLLRTELLVLDRASLPSEDEQLQDLAAILDVLGDRPVVVRVLDAGGDKPVRALRLDPRRNGFLGVRGLRWLLTEPAVLKTQLRAICRAAEGRRVAVLAPMVSLASEAKAFRGAVDDAVASLVADGLAHTAPDAVGVMIEVPAAALAADEIADVVDFVSIGTNDLVSYTMAADRTEPGVAGLLEPRATAIWRLIEQACDRARGRADIAVCGELAAVPEFAERFVRFGVGELSMAPAAIPALKRHLRSL